MTPELAEHISALAAPIYAQMLAPWAATGETITAEMAATMRKRAIEQAQALWLATLDTPDSDHSG